MRKLIVLLSSLCGLVLFVPSAGAQSTSHVEAWGKVFGPSVVTLSGGPASPAEIADVYTTNADTFVLGTDGKVYAAGGNDHGGLGNGSDTPPTSSTFSAVKFQNFPSGDKIVSVASVGPAETEMAIDSEGDVWGWGNNSYDQLCKTGQKDEAVELKGLPAGDYTMAAGAGDHASYYNSTTNTIYSCGENTYGELGDGSTDTSPSPTPEPVTAFDTTATVTAMTASWRNEGVIMSDGSYWNWGINTYGQLGDDSITESSVPIEVQFPSNASVQSVSEGGGGTTDGQSMALLSDGTYWGWGDDTLGQLCDDKSGVTNTYVTPTEITPPEALSTVASGGTTGYLLATSGDLYACGDDTQGQIGNGHDGGDHVPPKQVLVGDTVTQLSSTNYNVSVLVDDE